MRISIDLRPWALALLPALVLGLCLPGAAAAASKPAAKTKKKACKPGQGTLEIGRRSSCVRAQALLPRKKLGPDTVLGWADAVLHPGLGGTRAVVPKRLRGPEMGRRVAGGIKSLRKGLAPYGRRMESRAAGARASAMELSTGPVTTNQTADGTSVRVHGSIRGTDSATGTTVEATIGLGAKAFSTTLDFEVGTTITDRDGKSKTTELAIPIEMNTKEAQRCPTASGEIKRSSNFKGRRTTRERGTPPGFEYRNESMTFSSPITVTGQVGADAALSSVSYRVDGKFEYAYAASALRGIGRGSVQAEIDIKAQGTLDGHSGATTSGTTTLSGKMRSLHLNAAEEKAEMAKLLADPDYRDPFLKLVAKMVEREFDALKKAEKVWQTPNACAKMALTPPGATLEEGDSTGVSGSVSAEDGKPAEGRWSLASQGRGEASGLPGSSSASEPIELTMTGGAATATRRTVDLSLRATSPAGVAESPWTADGTEQTLYFRVLGGSGSQTASGYLEGNGCIIDQTGVVGPWTYAFQQASGEPDGEVSVETAGAQGAVRGSGVSTRPGYTWRSTCSPDPPTTFVHQPLSHEGRFGPLVEFFPVAGQPQAVEVVWDILAPAPIFQVEASGPICTPNQFEVGSPFRSQIPLSTLQQTAPFTLSVNAPWSTISEAGPNYTECSGQTTLSLTMQRVGPDGGPLG